MSIFTVINDCTFEYTKRPKSSDKRPNDIRFDNLLFIPAFIDNFMSSWGTITNANFRKYVSEWARDHVATQHSYSRVPTQFGDALRIKEASIYSDIKFVSNRDWLRNPKTEATFEEWLHDAVIEGSLRHAHCAISGCNEQFFPVFTESEFFTSRVTTEMYANVAVFINKIASPLMKI